MKIILNINDALEWRNSTDGKHYITRLHKLENGDPVVDQIEEAYMKILESYSLHEVAYCLEEDYNHALENYRQAKSMLDHAERACSAVWDDINKIYDELNELPWEVYDEQD